MGIGLVLVVGRGSVDALIKHAESHGHRANRIGEIVSGSKHVQLLGE